MTCNRVGINWVAWQQCYPKIFWKNHKNPIEIWKVCKAFLIQSGRFAIRKVRTFSYSDLQQAQSELLQCNAAAYSKFSNIMEFKFISSPTAKANKLKPTLNFHLQKDLEVQLKKWRSQKDFTAERKKCEVLSTDSVLSIFLSNFFICLRALQFFHFQSTHLIFQLISQTSNIVGLLIDNNLNFVRKLSFC